MMALTLNNEWPNQNHDLTVLGQRGTGWECVCTAHLPRGTARNI